MVAEPNRNDVGLIDDIDVVVRVVRRNAHQQHHVEVGQDLILSDREAFGDVAERWGALFDDPGNHRQDSPIAVCRSDALAHRANPSR